MLIHQAEQWIEGITKQLLDELGMRDCEVFFVSCLLPNGLTPEVAYTCFVRISAVGQNGFSFQVPYDPETEDEAVMKKVIEEELRKHVC